MANNNDKPRRGGIWSFYFLVLLVLVGCGGGGSDAPPPRVPVAQSVDVAAAATYFPQTEGNGWVYQVTLSDAAAAPFLEQPLPLHICCTSRQFDEANVVSGRDLDGDGVHDLMDIVAEVTGIGWGTAAVPAGRFANCVVMQQRLTLTTHASKTGAAPHGN